MIDLTAEDQEQDKENRRQVEVDTPSSDNPPAMDFPAHLQSDDYFEVLNLPSSASEADVKRAYRRLAVQWHPDKNRSSPQAEEFFKKISEAYEVLSDPEKRKLYEKYGKDGLNGGGGSATPHSRDGEDHFAFGGGFSTQHARDIFDAFLAARTHLKRS